MKTLLDNFITKKIEGNYTSFMDNGKQYTGKVMIVTFTDEGVHYIVKDGSGKTHDIVNDDIIPRNQLDFDNVINSF